MNRIDRRRYLIRRIFTLKLLTKKNNLLASCVDASIRSCDNVVPIFCEEISEFFIH